MDSLIKILNPHRAAFGRHETFALRYSWLTKGFQAFKNNPDIFTSDNATIELGVGKNMANSIRYWLRATQLIEDSASGFVATELGDCLLSSEGFDPFLEDEATLWLIHWLLATNAEMSTAWYWFFNHFHKAEFTTLEAANTLADFVQNQLDGKHSENTVRHEISLILRMYCKVDAPADADLQDYLDAPLTSLKLISSLGGHQTYHSISEPQSSLPIGILGFAVNELFNFRNESTLPIRELMYGEKQSVGIGSIFRLTESAFLAKLELLIKAYPAYFQLNETAGIHQLYRTDNTVTSVSFLSDHYNDLGTTGALNGR